MDLLNTIQAVHSKAQSDKIVKWVGHHQDRFDQLFVLFLHGEYRVIQRAAWPLSYCVENYPVLIRKHITALVNNLDKSGQHDAVKRNSIRILQYVDIPKRLQGKVMNKCFEYITDPQEKAAVKAFSLTVLYNLSKLYPDISQELKTIIEECQSQETPAFRARGRQILKALAKPARSPASKR